MKKIYKNCKKLKLIIINKKKQKIDKIIYFKMNFIVFAIDWFFKYQHHKT
jgi:hypothetical protein